MRRRKSSKNLKPSAISTPTLLSSSFKQDEAPPVPSHPSLSPLQSSSTSLGASSPPRGGGQQRISDQPTGLSRFLSRLKRKPEGHAPQLLRAASVERFGRPETSLHPVRRDPPDIVAPPNSAPFDRTRFGSIKSVEPLTRSASANTSPQSKMPTPAAASRAPVSYDVVKTRKRAGSLSQSTGSATGSISPSPGSSSETWTPLDPETSMASWRSSVATEVERPNSSAESVRKLREAADALGLDQSGVDQLVANATPPITVDTIPEEPSPLSGSQTPRNVVRRTIIVGSAGDAERISQMATNGPDSTLPHRSSSLKSTRAHPLRRSQTFSHSFSNESPAHASNHRKINSETAPKGAYTVGFFQL